MRKWMAAHRKAVALVVLVCVYAAGMALFVTWGRPLDETLISAAIWFGFTVVSALIQERGFRALEGGQTVIVDWRLGQQDEYSVVATAIYVSE